MLGFFISALFFLCTANYIAGHLDRATFMWWDIIDSFAAMLAIPTMYLYFRSMIHEERFTWKEYIWFVPALVVGVGTTGLYLMMDKIEMEGYIQSVLIERKEGSNYSDVIYKLHQFIGVKIYNLTALVQIVGLSIFAILGVQKYHKRLCEFYSDADDKSINTNNRLLRWFLFTIPLSLALIVPDIKFWIESPLFSSVLFIAWAAVYFALFHYGSQKGHTVDNFVEDLQQADFEEKCYCGATEEEVEESNIDGKEIQDIQISPEVCQRLVILLTKLIDEEKVYLKRDLRLDEVAQRIFTNRAYVSKVIKEKYQCSFSDYINRKRIDFSMELMRLNPNLTQDKIAEKSGFVSAQSYSRTFKKIIGIPPKEWLNRNIHQS
ncbi:MAG: helix-turn-helix transcriptional regulator [Bacteroidales bacterium]